jgi:hypothetical protein
LISHRPMSLISVLVFVLSSLEGSEMLKLGIIEKGWYCGCHVSNGIRKIIWITRIRGRVFRRLRKWLLSWVNMAKTISENLQHQIRKNLSAGLGDGTRNYAEAAKSCGGTFFRSCGCATTKIYKRRLNPLMGSGNMSSGFISPKESRHTNSFQMVSESTIIIMNVISRNRLLTDKRLWNQ